MCCVIIPFPGPNSTNTSTLEKSISLSILFAKKRELGVKVPKVLKFLIASLKKIILFVNWDYLFNFSILMLTSTKMHFLKDFFYIFYPKICANCKEQLLQNEKIICTFCRHDLPLTNFQSYTKNKVSSIFLGRITIEKAYSLFRIHPCPDGPQFLNLEASKEFSNSEEYLNHLYQIGDIILEHGTIEVLLDQIRTWLKKPNYLPPE